MNTTTAHRIPNSETWYSALRPAVGLMLIGFGFSGFIYCLIATGLAQLFFPYQANGSLIVQNGNIAGSALVGQYFQAANYFHARPSASHYSVDAATGSNLARSNPVLKQQIQQRQQQFAQLNQIDLQQVPLEMQTASASGIDPDISPKSALLQVPRVAQARHLDEQRVKNLVIQQIQPKQWGVFGQERVNVLQLNLALNQLSQANPR